MKVTGKITTIKTKEQGTSKNGKAWSKVQFLLETDESYNNLYCFELFQMDDQEEEKKKVVDNFLKFNKVNTIVDVDFNVKTTEWKGKHFVSLSAWKVFKAEAGTSVEIGTSVFDENASDGLPF